MHACTVFQKVHGAPRPLVKVITGGQEPPACQPRRLPSGATSTPPLPSRQAKGRFSPTLPSCQTKGYFNVVIIFLWFWYDPQPSVAELVLPMVRAHSPAGKQPFVALLSDDAHAIRSSRLGEVEIHPGTRDGPQLHI